VKGRGPTRWYLTPLTLGLLCVGCAAHAPRPAAVAAPAAGLPRVAFLPLENLSGRGEAEDRLTRIFYSALAQTGTCEVVETGDVEAAYRDMRIRTTGMLTSQQAVRLGERLRARYLLTGSILEYAMVRTPDGEVPAVGVALRMLEADSARVVWTAMRVRTGEDRETIFGWGRELSQEKLAERLAREMFEKFQLPAGVDSTTGSGGRP
jgi:TolB-like protein